MTLQEWMRRKKMTDEQFAALVDETCNQSLVSKWRRGRVLPSEARRHQIAVVTGGEVTVLGQERLYKRLKAKSKARGEAWRKERGIE